MPNCPNCKLDHTEYGLRRDDQCGRVRRLADSKKAALLCGTVKTEPLGTPTAHQTKAADTVVTPKTSQVANIPKVANKHGKYSDTEGRKIYMRNYMAKRRATQKTKEVSNHANDI